MRTSTPWAFNSVASTTSAPIRPNTSVASRARAQPNPIPNQPARRFIMARQTLELVTNVGFIDQEKYGLPEEVVNNEGAIVTVDERVANILTKVLNVARPPEAKKDHDEAVHRQAVQAVLPAVKARLAREEAEKEAEAMLRGGHTRVGVGRQKPGPPSSEADESPLSETNASEAIDQISRMRNQDKLNSIVSTDSRPTVKAAAQKRLDELK